MTTGPDSGVPFFSWCDGALCCEDVAVAELVARFGSPLHVYSRAAMEARFAALRAAFGADAHVCYAVKSNANLNLLALFAQLGSGFDLVSGGELRRLQRADVPVAGAVFAGVGKERWEVEAALDAEVMFLSIESAHEVDALAAIAAERGVVARVALRLNPDVDPQTHDYISTGRRRDKFGVDLGEAAGVVAAITASPHLELVGYHVHLGSQLRSVQPYLDAFEAVERFFTASPDRLAGVRYYDLGGGFGITYGDGGEPLDVGALGAALLPRLARHGLQPVLEPGRYLVGDAGILVTRVLGTKQAGDRTFAIVDGAMNDLLRPALYGAEHPVAPVLEGRGPSGRYDLVGPVCETGDFLARGVELPAVQEGDLLSVFATGAYGMSMASNYNSRRRPAEVLVEGGAFRLIRRRERWEDLWATEVEPCD